LDRRARARFADPINKIREILAAVRRVVSLDHPPLMIQNYDAMILRSPIDADEIL
jgi:hypothetical protein